MAVKIPNHREVQSTYPGEKKSKTPQPCLSMRHQRATSGRVSLDRTQKLFLEKVRSFKKKVIQATNFATEANMYAVY